jgi:hypothetical protein
MADLKISQLTGATTPLAGTEVLPVVQSSTTKKVSVANLTAGRVVEVAQLNLISGDTTAEILLKDTGTTNYYVRVKSRNNTMELVSGNGVTATLDASNNIKFEAGNLIQGTAAKGINFTANTPAAGMTSQLLNWYEEGTWTPNQGAGLTLVGAFSSAGTYTRIGRQVFIRGSVSGATSVAVASTGAITTNLPYSAAADATGTAINAANNASSILRISSATLTAATAIAATATITFSGVYSV